MNLPEFPKVENLSQGLSSKNSCEQGSSEPVLEIIPGPADQFLGKAPTLFNLFEQVSSPLLGLAKLFAAAGGNKSLRVNPRSFNFGDVPIRNTRNRHFSIHNPGCDPIQVSILAPNGFRVSPSSFRIPGGGRRRVNIYFTPQSERTYTGSVSISPMGIGVSVRGRGIDPNQSK